MAEMATAALDAPSSAAARSRGRVTVTPDPFTLDRVRRGDDRRDRRGRRGAGRLPARRRDRRRRRRGAVRAARPGTCPTSSTARVELWISGAQPRGQHAAAHVLAPSRPASTSTIDAAARQGPALRRLRRRAAPTASSRAASAPRGTSTRSAGPQRLGRRRCAARRSCTSSGSSTASPTSPTPRSSAAGTPIDDVGRHPRDLQGDRRRRPRRRRRSPSTSSARSSDAPPLSRARPASVEVVRGDVSKRSIVGLRREQRRRTARAISVMSARVEVGLDRVGRLPLLDHEEATTVRDRRDEVDVAARGLVRGSARRSAPAPRRARSSAPGRRRTPRSAPRSRPRRASRPHRSVAPRSDADRPRRPRAAENGRLTRSVSYRARVGPGSGAGGGYGCRSENSRADGSSGTKD